MNVFFDTSAIVKLFHEEDGTGAVTVLAGDPNNDLYISALTTLEFASVLQRLSRTHIISSNDLTVIMDVFREELERFTIKSLNRTVISEAEKLLLGYGQTCSLRSLDALQLASFIALDLKDGLFVASDQKLLKAAEKVGVKVYNPTG